MANGTDRGSGNTAVVAIVVIIVVAILAFFLFFRPAGTDVQSEDRPDVEVQVNPENGAGDETPAGDQDGDGGDAGGNGGSDVP